jgi:hypothetical protein
LDEKDAGVAPDDGEDADERMLRIRALDGDGGPRKMPPRPKGTRRAILP